jgi:hypothetical protein
VIVDTRGDKRVGELQQNRARPAEEDEPFGVQALGDYCGSFSARLASPALSTALSAGAPAEAEALAEADFHNQPATPTSARPMAPWRTSCHPLPFGLCPGSSSVRYA